MKIVALITFVVSFSYAFSQNDKINDSLKSDAVNIYIDCNFCDKDHIRREIPYVNFVRDTKEADVHVMFTTENTGSGGTEYTITFIGQGKYKDKADTLKYIAGPDATSDERRLGRLKILKIGLVQYVAKTSYINDMNVNYTKESEDAEVIDKWNNWVFRLSASGWFNGDANYRTTNLSGNVSSEHITEEWINEFKFYTNYNEDIYIIEDGEDIKSNRKNYSFNTLNVKSINDHWSYGGYTSVYSSLYSNYEYQISASPALEYNLFKYSESTRKQLRFLYKMGYSYNSYNDTTIYNKINEGLFKTNLSVAFKIKEKWGSINTSVTGSMYLHDFDKNSLYIYNRLDIRILKGLSFYISGGVSFSHGQLNLAKGDVSEQDILLRQRQLASQYNYWCNAGISYTFGSIYNNVVNLRFGN